jgi:hypothetical protein
LLAPRLAGRLIKHPSTVAFMMVVAGVLGFAFFGAHGGDGERIIEKVGAFDPLTEGFQTHEELTGAVVRNADSTGFIGWSVSSSDAGGAFYYRRLTDAQKKRALSRGWTLSAVMQSNKGGATANVDFLGYGKRYDINVLIEPDVDIVRLNTQLVPTIQGQELRLPRMHPVYHKYELRFDPGLQIADLWVDGEKRLTGYRGHNQFQGVYGLMFGAALHKSDREMASFQSVRFEINP